MASISYPTQVSIPGPWFLETKNLLELDDVVQSCIENMRRRRDELLTRKAEEEAEKYPLVYPTVTEAKETVTKTWPFDQDYRAVTIFLGGGRTASGATFKDLMTLSHVHEEIPRGFELKAATADTHVRVKLTSWGNRELDLEVVSDDHEFEQQLLGRLQNWASDIQPKRWLQWWLAHTWVFGLLVLFFSCAGLPIIVGETLKTPETTNPLREEAREMAKQVITTANEAKAIQLILSLESGYSPVPEPAHKHLGIRFWLYIALVYLVLAALSFAPRGGIGLWQGRQSLEKQKLWLRTVSISVPGLIVSSVAVPFVLNLLGWPK